jgi:hypothetical protein
VKAVVHTGGVDEEVPTVELGRKGTATIRPNLAQASGQLFRQAHFTSFPSPYVGPNLHFAHGNAIVDCLLGSIINSVYEDGTGLAGHKKAPPVATDGASDVGPVPYALA